MKSWSTESNPKADLEYDEAPAAPITISEQFRSMKYVYRSVPRDQVNLVLETLGLRRVAQ